MSAALPPHTEGSAASGRIANLALSSQQPVRDRGSSTSAQPETAVWQLIAPEFPPELGGVGDYTRLLAQELARRGQQVHVWTRGDSADAEQDGFVLHRKFGGFGMSGLWRVG